MIARRWKECHRRAIFILKDVKKEGSLCVIMEKALSLHFEKNNHKMGKSCTKETPEKMKGKTRKNKGNYLID